MDGVGDQTVSLRSIEQRGSDEGGGGGGIEKTLEKRSESYEEGGGVVARVRGRGEATSGELLRRRIAMGGWPLRGARSLQAS